MRRSDLTCAIAAMAAAVPSVTRARRIARAGGSAMAIAGVVILASGLIG